MPLQVLTTWMSALHPQNMLEQLLIHQPTDPIPFMIDHLQLDNDYGKHWAGPPPAPPPPAPPPPLSPSRLLLGASGKVLPYLRGGQGWVGKGFGNSGRWLIEKRLNFFWSTANTDPPAKLLK